MSLLDRGNFLAHLRGKGPPLIGTCPRVAAEAALIVDQCPSSRLDALLEQLDELERAMPIHDPEEDGSVRRSKFAEWARRRVQAADRHGAGR